MAVKPFNKVPVQYPHVNQIEDHPTKATLRLVWDQLREHNQNVLDLNSRIDTLASILATTAATAASAINLAAIANNPKASPIVAAVTAGNNAPGASADDGGLAEAGFASAPATGHLPAGTPMDLTAVGMIVGGVDNEFPALLLAAVDQPTRDANQLELLKRIIWHLNLFGFVAGRQKNPSGATSADKITVTVGTVLWAFDLFTGPPFNQPLGAHIIPVTPASYIAEPGTAD